MRSVIPAGGVIVLLDESTATKMSLQGFVVVIAVAVAEALDPDAPVPIAPKGFASTDARL
jgi:hypothetical protein